VFVEKAAPKQKVLVAEDDPDTLRLITLVLSRRGFEVVSAADGREALRKVAAEQPAAILLDIMMPQLDGLAVVSKLKEQESTARIPVVFLTARTDTEAYKQGLHRGGLFYITKPFQPDKLVNLVEVLLASRPKQD